MGGKALRYSFGAIALYLVLYAGTNSGDLIKKGASGAGDLVKAFQGR